MSQVGEKPQHSGLRDSVVAAVAHEIRLTRYLSCSVSDEQLVEQVILLYGERAQFPRGMAKGSGRDGRKS